ncbi:hypothetical protein [Burkholderia phage BCSR129]|nr:hypothetical protein [Burkholderia phage BCSR129]
MSGQQYDNELRGVLFKTREKRNERSPDYNGNCQIDGVEYWVSGWVKEGRSGKFLSLSFNKKDQNAQPRRAASSDGDDDFLGGAPAGNSRPTTSGRMTPQQVSEMGRTSGNRPQNQTGDWEDDIPF